MEDSTSISEREQRLIDYLVRQQGGWVMQAALVDELRVNKSTIRRVAERLQKRGEPIEFADDGALRIDMARLRTHVRLNLHQSTATFLATRLLARYSDKPNRHAVEALLELGKAMVQQKTAAPIGQHIIRTSEWLRQRGDIDDKSDFVGHLEKITDAWANGYKISLDYQPLRGQALNNHLFRPYFLEPSAIGYSTYVIGLDETLGQLRARKVERITGVTTQPQWPFQIPAEFDPAKLLGSAWGIWFGEEDRQETVQLRFTGVDVVKRVKESTWHPSQRRISETHDELVWEVEVDAWREMLPWVRGWGSAVIVEKPEEMRAEVRRGVREMARAYGVMEQKDMPKHWRLWAKADKRTNELHRLIYHLTDVGMTAHAIWNKALGADLKMRIAAWLKTGEADAGRLIAFWASLHDLGKASPAFQDHQNVTSKLREKIHIELKKANLVVRDRGKVKHARHEVISAWSLDKEGWLISLTQLNGQLANLIAQMLGGHHGAWPDSTLFLPEFLKAEDKGDETWRDMRRALVEAMIAIFQPPPLLDFLPGTTEDNVMLALISGIVSLADWLGSDEKNFAYEEAFVDVGDYASRARELAAQALTRAEWESAPLAAAFNFYTAFGFQPNEAQTEIVDALQDAILPALAIIEAPMGSGKTEAALATWAAWVQKMGQSRMYVAMPTTATSNQMWGRVDEFLGKHQGTNAKPMLVHGQALLRRADPVPEADDTVEEKDKDQQGDHAASQTWFLPRKRSLLVPFGVGTVDQALMSVLQTKHFFVRLLGLAGKVVIFDEVHAYDAYMNTLFSRLLQWLRQVGASVIVLSATLPEKARSQLINAWGADEVPQARYPRLTWANANSKQARVLELQPPPKRTLLYGWIKRDVETLIQKLRDELRGGGCAAVICNTVTRAQQVYDAVNSDAELKQIDAGNRLLFHARFPLAWREGIEKRVLGKFGPHSKDKKLPNPERPEKAIVIATQVIEQSLDLDFDVMISDHAPVDLLLQRAGRLHRHVANAPMRKHADVLWVAEPDVTEGLPMFARGDTYVYDEYVLLRSWLALKQRVAQQVVLPEDVSALIEQVYGEQSLGEISPEMVVRLAKVKREMETEIIEAEDKADENLIREPNYRHLLFKQRNHELDEDNPDLNVAFRALTRLGDPGVNLVCLERAGDDIFVMGDDQRWRYEPDKALQKDIVIKLARSVVNVRHPDMSLQIALLHPKMDSEEAAIMASWRKVSALRHCAVAIFEEGKYRTEGMNYLFMLDQEFGLRIKKEL